MEPIKEMKMIFITVSTILIAMGGSQRALSTPAPTAELTFEESEPCPFVQKRTPKGEETLEFANAEDTRFVVSKACIATGRLLIPKGYALAAPLQVIAGYEAQFMSDGDELSFGLRVRLGREVAGDEKSLLYHTSGSKPWVFNPQLELALDPQSSCTDDTELDVAITMDRFLNNSQSDAPMSFWFQNLILGPLALTQLDCPNQ